MPSSILTGQEHPLELLALFVQDEGILADAYQVEYQIFDDSSSLSGTQLYPAVAGNREDVTIGSGHYGTGQYGAWDSVTGAPWVPSADVARGRVVWYYTLVEGGAERVVERRFEALSSTVASQPDQSLALIQDMRDADITTSLVSDRDVYLTIRTWSELVRRYTGHSFLPEYKLKRLKWRPLATLHFSEPLFGLAEFRVDGSDAYDLDYLRVWGVGFDERRNSRIEFISAYGPRFGFVRRCIVRVTGVWGYFDPDTFDPPVALQDMTIDAIVKVLDEDTGPGSYGSIKREKVDGHEIEYNFTLSATRSGMLALLKSAAFRDLLDLYKAPNGISAAGGL